MNRRDVLCFVGGSVALCGWGRAIASEDLATRIDVSVKRRLADAALDAAKSAGAAYCDVRVGRYLRQSVQTREKTVQSILNTESIGVGIRVIVNGAWGFSATNDMRVDAVAEAARTAVAVARANATFQTEPVQLAPAPAQGEKHWATPLQINAMEVPIKDKVELLLAVNAAAQAAGADFVRSQLFLVNEQKYFASSDGSYIDQDVHRLWAPFSVTAIDRQSGKFRSRDGLSSPVGMGWEFMTLKSQDRYEAPNGVVAYGSSYDMVADAVAAARQAREKLTAPSVKPGRYDLVLDPTHTFLTIHESVGHPLELDRVLGYEANFAGTSFATIDKRDAGLMYGSKLVNFEADRTQPGSLGAIGWDDEGVRAKRWDLVRDGKLVDYQTIRDQAHILGKTESDGCSYAASWSDVQFQRMPNVSLKPGTQQLSVAQMISQVENGIYFFGRGSYSIDQQRYNAQFGGQLFYEIKNGKITGMIEDVAYQMRTPEFWNACTAICDARDWRMGGSFFDGKGQPEQVSAVSHGSATARFNGINVINTARAIG